MRRTRPPRIPAPTAVSAAARPDRTRLAEPTPLSRVAQRKLRVGAANDPFEHQADEIARLVVGRSHTDPTGDTATGRVRRRPGDTAQRSDATARPRIQRRAPIGREGGDLDPETERTLHSARSGGRALDAGLQEDIGSVVGADVSGVRLHSGDVSRSLNEQMSAEAFTVGNDVFFRDGLPDTSTDQGLGLVAHEVAHTVQQGASPVSRRWSAERDGEEETAETEAEEETAEEAPEEAVAETEAEEETETEAEETPAAEVTMSGTIGSITERTRPEDIAGLGNREEDAARAQSLGREPTQPATAPRTSRSVDVESRIGTSSTMRHAGDVVDDVDAMRGGSISATGQITGPVATTDAFGAMATNISFSGVTWKYVKGKVVVDLTIDGVYEWEVYGDTNIDISKPDDPHITADNYAEIADDLTPQMEGKCWRPPRDNYWSEALTERHEKYHAKDADGWVKKKGPGVVKSYLKKNPIEIADDERDDKAAVQAKVDDVLDEALDAVIEGRRYYFRKDISDYLKYPGEIRAFGDGKAPYAKLAKGVRAHGKKLAKEKAASEKAKKKVEATPTPPTDGATPT